MPIYVVLTLRPTHRRMLALPRARGGDQRESQFLVPRLTRDQLKAAIEGPAAVGGAEATPRLLQRLLGDVGEDSDQLPLLQHALMRTWERWLEAGAQGPLDLPHYEATGGIKEALSRHADEAWAELDLEGQRIARQLFRALTDKGDDQRGCAGRPRSARWRRPRRRPRPRWRRWPRLFRRRGRSFLMPPEGVALEEATVLDISHESLMRVWQRLRDWVEQEGASAARWRRLAESAWLWAAGQTRLLRDPELAATTAWWNEEKPTAAWAGRYGGDFAATADFSSAAAGAPNGSTGCSSRPCP